MYTASCFIAFDSQWRLHAGLKKIAMHELSSVPVPAQQSVNGTDAATTRVGSVIDCCVHCIKTEQCDYFMHHKGTNQCVLYDLAISNELGKRTADPASIELQQTTSAHAGYFRWA